MILFLARTGVTGSLCLKMVPLVTAGEVLWQASSVGGTWSLGMGIWGREKQRVRRKRKSQTLHSLRETGAPHPHGIHVLLSEDLR